MCRQEHGIFDTLSELVTYSLQSYPDEEVAASLIVELTERIFLQSVTSPLNLHLSIANKVLVSLLESTAFEYHSKLASSIMSLIEALYLELKTLKQDPFKKKVLQKLCNAISLLLGTSNAETAL